MHQQFDQHGQRILIVECDSPEGKFFILNTEVKWTKEQCFKFTKPKLNECNRLYFLNEDQVMHIPGGTSTTLTEIDVWDPINGFEEVVSSARSYAH